MLWETLVEPNFNLGQCVPLASALHVVRSREGCQVSLCVKPLSCMQPVGPYQNHGTTKMKFCVHGIYQISFVSRCTQNTPSSLEWVVDSRGASLLMFLCVASLALIALWVIARVSDFCSLMVGQHALGGRPLKRSNHSVPLKVRLISVLSSKARLIVGLEVLRRFCQIPSIHACSTSPSQIANVLPW